MSANRENERQRVDEPRSGMGLKALGKKTEYRMIIREKNSWAEKFFKLEGLKTT